jgi:hypothetical protein
LSPELVRPFGSLAAGTELLRRAADAALVHRDIATAWAELPQDAKPALLPYFGRGHRTLSRASVRCGRLRVEKVDPEWRGNIGWYGDGTVPALSAIPGELSGQPELAQAVPDKHGPMGTTAAVVEKLVTLQSDDIPVRGTDRPPMPWIGWDIDDTVPASKETVVGAELHHGASQPVEGSGSAASLLLTGREKRILVAMTLGADGWGVTLPPMHEGVYRLDIEVKDAWHGTSVFASTPLAVLDPPTDAEPDVGSDTGL